MNWLAPPKHDIIMWPPSVEDETVTTHESLQYFSYTQQTEQNRTDPRYMSPHVTLII